MKGAYADHGYGKSRDHRRIAWRLSAWITGAHIASFIVIDCLLLLLILVYKAGTGLFESSPFVNNTLTIAFQYIGSIRYLDITSFWVLVSFGTIQIILVIGHAISVRKQIRDQLEPLRELRVAADVFAGAAAGASGGGISTEALRHMADALSHVEARDMNAHISEESVSPELRPLLETIKDMLDRLEASYAAQAKFVADASHELRTPVAVIQGYSNLLSRWGSEDPDTLRESIEAIKSEAEMMKQMINQLLFLARGDSDTLRVNLQPVDLIPIANEVLREEIMLEQERELIRGGDERITHEIEARYPQGKVIASADPALLKQLIRILMENSIKYTEPGGSILLSVSSDDKKNIAQIIVQDEGQGIPTDVLPRIFDRFGRADEARARNTGGSGLGLSIAKQITERHNGSLDVFSVEGAGSRFTVSLPLIASTENPAGPDPP